MLHNTLSALLVSLASRYAELSPSDVGIGIGGGRLVIDDVKLRAETFNSPRLPFYVHQGRAGRLRVNVPWSALSSSPVEVYLENVHLVAGPKQSQTTSEPRNDSSNEQLAVNGSQGKQKGSAEKARGPWHQTAVGRLAFNVSVEMYGLKVEYRDQSCVGIISIASLRAFSAGQDWNSKFLSLSLDPHANAADTTTAVAMRKLVRLSGVHWVMIPRSHADAPGPTPDETQHTLDLESFESQSPIIDGIGISVRVLLCTGKASIHPGTRPTAGLHAEIEVDLEDPSVNLTARQMKWIDHIMKQGLGFGSKPSKPAPPFAPLVDQSSSATTKRRPRSVLSPNSPQHTSNQNGIQLQSADQTLDKTQGLSQDSRIDKASSIPPAPSDTDSISLSQNGKESLPDDYRDDVIDAEIEKLSDYDEDGYDDHESDEYDDEESYESTSPKGGLLSFWQAIVGENGDETIDDAAIALGLSDAYDSPSENEDGFEEQEDDQSDHQYARNAVAAAAKAGGVSLQLRLRTPDMAAWDLVERLQGEAERDTDVRKRLKDIETVLEIAEARVRASEEKAQVLSERNANIMREMEDLELLTSQAGRNKDAMIRQMEAALVKAERKLQEIYQERFRLQEEVGPVAASPSVVSRNVALDTAPDEGSLQPEIESSGSVAEESHMPQQSETDTHKSEAESFVQSDQSVEETEAGDGYIEPQDETAEAVHCQVESHDETSTTPLPLVAPPPQSFPETRHVEKEEEMIGLMSPGMQEIVLDNIVHEEHLAGIGTHKLEEVMSSEGLTLI